MSFRVQKKQCKTCIYRSDCPLDIAKLEDQVRDKYIGFSGHRICHHPSKQEPICCRGFWNLHKDEFAAGQIAQRLNCVEFVTVDYLA